MTTIRPNAPHPVPTIRAVTCRAAPSLYRRTSPCRLDTPVLASLPTFPTDPTDDSGPARPTCLTHPSRADIPTHAVPRPCRQSSPGQAMPTYQSGPCRVDVPSQAIPTNQNIPSRSRLSDPRQSRTTILPKPAPTDTSAHGKPFRPDIPRCAIPTRQALPDPTVRQAEPHPIVPNPARLSKPSLIPLDKPRRPS